VIKKVVSLPARSGASYSCRSGFSSTPLKILLEQPIALKFGMQVGWVLKNPAWYTSPSESPSFRSRTGFSADLGTFFDFSSVRQGYSSHGRSSGAETSAIVALWSLLFAFVIPVPNGFSYSEQDLQEDLRFDDFCIFGFSCA